jgi:hypothetical protein
LELLAQDGSIVAELAEKPVWGTYPTAWWQAGELVKDPHRLYVPAPAPPGQYQLTLSLVRAADGTLATYKRGRQVVSLGQVDVLGRDHHYLPVTPPYAQAASFGPSVELVGYDLREAVRAPGSPLAVTLHWHVVETPDKAYHTFVHLLGANGEIVSQHDGPPGEGQLPALGWLPGEYLADLHLLQLPFDLADGDYRLAVGLYDPATGIRLGERVELRTAIPVKASGGCNCR